MDQFRQGLCNDVKDLLLTFHEDLKFLREAIRRDVQCDTPIGTNVRFNSCNTSTSSQTHFEGAQLRLK